MSDSSNNSSSGIGFGGLLTILFIGLKLAHVIDWSWWWVLAPLWIGITIAIAIMAAAGIAFLIASFIDR